MHLTSSPAPGVPRARTAASTGARPPQRALRTPRGQACPGRRPRQDSSRRGGGSSSVVLDPGAARFTRVLCVHIRKLLPRLGMPRVPLGRVDISQTCRGASGHSTRWGPAWGAHRGAYHSLSPLSSQPVFSWGPFLSGSFPTALHEQWTSSSSLTFFSGKSVS